MTNRTHTMVALVLAIVGMYSLRLHSVEIQPWDEGLYAARGESVIRHGDWVDQTAHAIGGLYSATAPPMTSWGVAVGLFVFGRGPVGVRFFTILCSGLALYMMLLIARKLVSYQGAILAACLLGSSVMWTVYSRQAMTEVPLMAFTLVALYGMTERKWWLIGLGFGLALLTKMTVSFLPVLFAIPYLIKRESRLFTSLGLLFGVALAFPWYAYMSSVYGADFYATLLAPHLLTNVEASVKSSGMLYYVNQLLISQPFTVIAFVFILTAFFRRQVLPDKNGILAWIIVVWFAFVLIIFSMASTKNPHYTVMLIPPAVLLTVYGLERLLHTGSRRTIVGIYLLLIMFTILTFTTSIRMIFKSDPLGVGTFIIVGFGIIALLLLLWLPVRVIDIIAVRMYKPVIYGLTAIAFLHSLTIIWKGHDSNVSGAREAATVLMESGSRSFVYLYHKQNEGDRYNPQLSWYTEGWMNGWTQGYTHVSVSMPRDTTDISSLAAIAISRQPYVVYYHADRQNINVRSVIASLSPSYDVIINNDNYTVFAVR